MNKKLNIGLFGFGVVGEGLYQILQQTPTLQATISKVCVKDSSKKRNAPAHLFTTNEEDILFDKNINVIVEVINDSEAAYNIVTTALHNGKAVVSANKKMIALNQERLLKLQQELNIPFLYEASACASIPIIRNLEEYYDNDLLQSLTAIVNGSTNFILSKMIDENKSYKDALLLAQQLGFAESNPLLDVEGYDAVNKLSILLNHSFGIVHDPSSYLFTGIQNISLEDAKIATEKGLRLKLVAQAYKLKSGSIAAFVLPQFIKKENPLSFVKNEYNGVIIESSFADKQFFYGKGAGSYPTASALLSDIAALRYNYKYEYKRYYDTKKPALNNDFYLNVYVGFDDINTIYKDKFEWIDEWHLGQNRKYLTGVIHAQNLLNSNWWKQNGVSLIVQPTAIYEEIKIKKIKQKSLSLAGV